MTDLLKLIRDLCLRRRGPQDMPYSVRLLVSFIAADLLLDLLAATVLGDAEGALQRFLLLTSFDLIALNIALSLRELRPRFVQTATALIACDVAFTLLMLPLKFAAGAPPVTPQDLTPLQVLIAWLSLGIFVWKIMVDANILRHALNLPAIGGYLLALLWIVAEAGLLVSVFGDKL